MQYLQNNIESENMTDQLPISTNIIENLIYTIRGVQVMLDSNLAEMYGVEAKQINRVLKRNEERFPELFVFQLTGNEWNSVRYQIGTLNADQNLRSQSVTSGKNSLRSQIVTLVLDQSLKFQNGTSSENSLFTKLQ